MSELSVPTKAGVIESVVIGGDLARITPEQRVSYYQAVCNSLGLNPLTKPFDYITLNGKLTLYARKDAADQLRSIHRVSILRLERELVDDVYTVTAYAQLPDGRQDSSMGAVNISGLKGDALANAFMKAETKAKRRVTLSICGLGMLDETEVTTIPDARGVEVNQETGEIHAASVSANVMMRWNELAAEAVTLGVKVPNIEGLDEQELIAAGKEFKARIEAAKAKTK